VINGPDLCVLAGPPEAIAAVQDQLTEREVKCRPLQTSHAFHSAMMDPMLEAFAQRVRQVELRPPRIRYASNLTADWATDELAHPDYWVRHVRQTVRFAEGVRRLFEEPDQILLEVGPGRTLSTLATRHPDRAAEQTALDSLRHPQDEQPDVAYLLNTLGKLWLEGVQVDWAGFHAGERRRRLALPAYPFERERFWVDAPRDAPQSYAEPSSLPGMKGPTPPGRGLEHVQSSYGEPISSQRMEGPTPSSRGLEQFQNRHGGEKGEEQALPAYEGGPRDEVEQKVAHIWQDVLGVKQVKVTDDFFAMGGHSMLLASLAVQVKKTFGRDLPLRAFFQAPTLEELANLLREEDPQREKDSRREEDSQREADSQCEEDSRHEPTSQGIEVPPAEVHREDTPVVTRKKKGFFPSSMRVRPDPRYPDLIRDTFWAGLKNRLLQQIASSIPGATSLRVWLHRARGVQIGEDVFIGYDVVLESAYPRLISIGSNVFISVRTVMIGHFMGSGKRAKLHGEHSIRIEDDVSIGPNVVILPNVTIGRGSVVAAGSVVSASVPPLTMVQGNPARPVARCGIPLMGNSYEKFINSLTLLDGGASA
jgi:acetyltransferase-like isoleucine patch superfamily enzyme/acyl carrier protein